jgi:S1-C subfamily serine protease
MTIGNIREGNTHFGQVQGVEILDIERASPAAATGLRKGDIITSINRVKVENPQQALEVARDDRSRILLNIRRGNSALFLLIQ